MARGRDATDVAIVMSFGPCMLAGFNLITEEVMSVAATSRWRFSAAAAPNRVPVAGAIRFFFRS